MFLEVHDERVDPETRATFHKHVEQCPECRDDFKWYGITVQALGNLEETAPPRDFVAQLNGRLEGAVSRSYLDFFKDLFSSAPLMPVPMGVAALAAVVVVGFFLYNQAVPETVTNPGSHMVAKSTGAQPRAGVKTAGTGSARFQLRTMAPQGLLSPASKSPLSHPSTNRPRYSMTAHNALPADSAQSSPSFPTLADRIGADNLTVESARVTRALESIKKMLPSIRGKLIEVKPREGMGEIMVGVMIPSKAYGDLTGELINHGAVEAGAGSNVTPPRLSEDGTKSVYLHIRLLPAP